jgi:translation initiation factor IF-2
MDPDTFEDDGNATEDEGAGGWLGAPGVADLEGPLRPAPEAGSGGGGGRGECAPSPAPLAPQHLTIPDQGAAPVGGAGQRAPSAAPSVPREAGPSGPGPTVGADHGLRVPHAGSGGATPPKLGGAGGKQHPPGRLAGGLPPTNAPGKPPRRAAAPTQPMLSMGPSLASLRWVRTPPDRSTGSNEARPGKGGGSSSGAWSQPRGRRGALGKGLKRRREAGETEVGRSSDPAPGPMTCT